MSTIPSYIRNEPRDNLGLQPNDWQVLKATTVEIATLLREQGQFMKMQANILEKQEKVRIESDKNNRRSVVSVIAVFIATLNVALLSFVRDTFGDAQITTSGNVVIGCLFVSIILALVPAFLTSFMNHGGVAHWFKSLGTFYAGVFTFDRNKMHRAMQNESDVIQPGDGDGKDSNDKDEELDNNLSTPGTRKKRGGYIYLFVYGHMMLFLSLVVKLGWFMLFLLPSVVILVVGIVVFVWEKQSSGVGFASSVTCLYAIFAILAFALNGVLRRRLKAAT